MKFSKTNILPKLFYLTNILIKNKELESDKKSIELYDFHITSTENIIQLINNTPDQDLTIILKSFFESECRAYGWSFLPNENGKETETIFWKLKEELGF